MIMRLLRKVVTFARRLACLLAHPVHRVWMAIDRVGYARHLGVTLGEDCAIHARPDLAFGQEPFLITLGNHVFISQGVQFINHDSATWVYRQQDDESEVYGRITVGDNVFIGLRVLILPGVRIGNNVIIGAGAVVTRDIPDNSVAVGVPARVIGTVDDYIVRSKAKAVPTHKIKGKRKRQVLLELFPE